MHPARLLSYDELSAALEERVRRGAVSYAEDGPLRLYIYSHRCVYDGLWDDVSVLARGLVLDREARRVCATPFPKFFNYGERGTALPDEPFEAYEKVDGSLAIVFHDGTRWRVVTKGSFSSAQARWAEAWLGDRLQLLERGATWLFELVAADNRIVVKYDFEGLVLLGGYAPDGHEYGRAHLAEVAGRLDCRLVGVVTATSLRELAAACETMDRHQEGFVVRFASGLRLKLKGLAYRRIHALLSDTTPLGLWRVLDAGDDLDRIRQEIPEEFWTDFDDIRGRLEAQLRSLTAHVEAVHAAWADRSDRELGLALEQVDPRARPYLFARRKLGDRWIADPRTRRALLREIRPNGNVLDGYVPSTGLLGALDDG